MSTPNPREVLAEWRKPPVDSSRPPDCNLAPRLADALEAALSELDSLKAPPSITGEMTMSHADFQTACRTLLAEFQEAGAAGGNPMFTILCEAIRVSRECVDGVKVDLASQAESLDRLARMQARAERAEKELDGLKADCEQLRHQRELAIQRGDKAERQADDQKLTAGVLGIALDGCRGERNGWQVRAVEAERQAQAMRAALLRHAVMTDGWCQACGFRGRHSPSCYVGQALAGDVGKGAA
jgi:hypothetical protein